MISQTAQSPIHLYKILVDHFDSEELRTLAFQLGIEYDDLLPRSKMNTARELVSYLQRHGRIEDLVTWLMERRPEAIGSLRPTRYTESTDPKWMTKFFQQVEEIEQQLNEILAATNLDRDQAKNLLNQFTDTPDQLLLNILDLNASPEVITYVTRFARTEYLLGCYLVKQERWYEGLRYLERSLVLRRRLENLDDLADTVYQIGRIQHLMGNLEEARIRYRDALRLYKQTNNLTGIATCQLSLGNLDIQLGFVLEGKFSLTQARAFYVDSKNEEKIKEVDSVLSLVQNLQERQLV